jgi:hypothetical protein
VCLCVCVCVFERVRVCVPAGFKHAARSPCARIFFLITYLCTCQELPFLYMYIFILIYVHRHLDMCTWACCFLQNVCVHLHPAYMYICIVLNMYICSLVPAEYLFTFADMCVRLLIRVYVCVYVHLHLDSCRICGQGLP